MPRLKLLRHDLSKLRPSEWGPYVDYWYGQEGIRGLGGPTPVILQRFRNAAQSHYGRNPHHAYKLDKPYTVNTELESLADWYAVSRFQHLSVSNKAFPPFKK